MGRINYLAERTNTSGSHVTQIKLRWKHMWLCKKRREPAWVRGSLASSSVGTNPELGHVTGMSSSREGAWPAVWPSCKSSACPGLSTFDTRSRMELEKLFLRSKLGMRTPCHVGCGPALVRIWSLLSKIRRIYSHISIYTHLHTSYLMFLYFLTLATSDAWIKE